MRWLKKGLTSRVYNGLNTSLIIAIVTNRVCLKMTLYGLKICVCFAYV